MIAFEAVLYPNNFFKLLKTTFTLSKPKRVIITILDDDDSEPIQLNYSQILQDSHAYTVSTADLAEATRRRDEMIALDGYAIPWEEAKAQLIKDGILDHA
jgi:hypothetical protein